MYQRVNDLQSDEKELEERCWIPFGIQTLTVGNEGGTFLLQPEDRLIDKDHLICLHIPANAVNTSVCKELSIRYAILVHGPFALHEDYELASRVVYINFNPDHLSESSKLELHLPHWASEREDVFTAVAPHKVDKNGQYNFVLSTIEENLHAPSVIIPISGHTSLFAVALRNDCQKSYLLLPFYCNQSKTELIVFVTYHCTVWCEILKEKNEELIDDRPAPFKPTKSYSYVKARFTSQVHFDGLVEIDLKELKLKKKYRTAEELQKAVENKLYPPALVCKTDYKEGMQRGSTQVEIQCTDGHDCVKTIAEYPLTVCGTSDTVTDPDLVINSTTDLLPYLDQLKTQLKLLGSALGIQSETAAIEKTSEDSTTKCLRVLEHWLKVTTNPSWSLLCAKLKGSELFNNIREQIEKDHRTF